MIQKLHTSRSYKGTRGYIALTTVLIVGLVASVIMVSLITLGLSASRSGNSVYLSAKARSAANACAEVALRQLRADSNYVASNVAITVETNQCSYTVLNTGGTTRQIDANATVENTTRKVRILISGLAPKVVISSWQEIP